MDQPDPVISVSGRIVNHSLYELDKGVRQLFMLTVSWADLPGVVARLGAERVDHYVHRLNDSRVNLFFGRPALVETVRRFVDKPLCELTAEEDFMLGALLGYDREQQCRRYLERTATAEHRDHAAGAAASPVSLC
ncbi:DUF2023 family protein [Pleomorphomonas carboxyditropha]|uniref:DUF2023 domain-containing protein n=1 Tax=Pleomorphomonas carboxyditropha TaxID=2023338 RepID=A0A2G9WVR8_9HYPH|nr:DUF2023 family protein [Pleomorphomonas carboxyditropha]PIO98801.1 hypothetical protein CJ014_13965 [Pleomorphomonas carboxyditropha]